ncbi:hypothetical protein AB0M79_21420 [Polymorphospora sp. NPDC051019]|uniref:hypothetical protein n=1 Tax=Polymorphospora sp. NPDC051019 TaxID=3155725 RepID=UPI00342645EA
MSQIPDDLAEVVRRAATVAAMHAGDPAEIRHRWRRRRRRRMTSAAAAVGTLVVVGVAIVPTAVRGSDDGPLPTAAGPTTTAGAYAAPAQRLLIGGAGVAISVVSAAGPATGIAELLPGSSITHHRLPEFAGWHRIVALADGRLVGLGSASVGTGPDAGSAPARLVVVSGSGVVESSRAVGTSDEQVRLIAATARVAYLWRAAGLVEHDLDSGGERRLLAAAVLGDLPDRLPIGRLDVLGGRLVLAGTRADPCRLRVVDLGTADAVEFGLSGLRCTGLGQVRISPDGARAAVSYQQATGEVRIALVDLADGGIGADAVIAGPSAPQAESVPKQPVGMAWYDDTTVRVAVVDPAADADGVYRPDEIRQETVRAGR